MTVHKLKHHKHFVVVQKTSIPSGNTADFTVVPQWQVVSGLSPDRQTRRFVFLRWLQSNRDGSPASAVASRGALLLADRNGKPFSR